MSKPDNLKQALEYFKRAYEYQMKGELDAAEEYYKQSIETFPTAEAYTFLGWTYSFKGKYEEAIDECKRAIAVDPDFGNPYNDIGAYLLELNRPDDAIPWLERATAAKRYESYHYPHFNLGRAYVAKDLYNRAIECFQKSLEIAPDYTIAEKAIEELRKKVN